MLKKLKVKFNLRTKMMVYICSVVLIAFAVTTTVVAVRASNLAKTEAMERIKQTTYRYGHETRIKIDAALDAARTLAQSLEGMKKRGLPPRAMIDGILKNVLENNPFFIGVWTCWEPNALDGRDQDYINAVGHDATGRYIPYWNRGSGNIDIEPLVNYDVEGDGDWYLVPKTTGKETILDPFIYPISGKDVLMSTVSVPIKYGGKVVGVAGIDMSLSSFVGLVDKIDLYGTGHAFLISNNGTVVSHPEHDMIGKPFAEHGAEEEVLKAIKDGKESSDIDEESHTGEAEFHVQTPIEIGHTETPWSFGAHVPMETVLKGARNIMYTTIFIGVVSVLILMAVVFFISRGIANPLLSASEVINKVALERDLTLEVPVKGNDEIGEMGREFNNMLRGLNDSFGVVGKAAEDVVTHAEDVAKRASANKERAEITVPKVEKAVEVLKKMGETAGEVAEGSVAQREAAEQTTKTTEKLTKAMNLVVESVKAQDKEAKNATERVEAMGETGAIVVATAGKQGESVKKVSEAVREMAKSVEEMNKASDQATRFGKNALKAVEEGSESVAATVDGMRAISESSEQIAEIITVITEIAEQTNLLSLNAAIEAARAGEHGKGFAVVADEVGKLAQRSSEAAKEITQLIKDSTNRVAEGTKLSTQSKNALEKIAEGGETNLKAIEEISNAAKFMAESNEKVNAMMAELNALAQEIAGMAGQQGERRETTKAALEALEEKSKEIAGLVEQTNKDAVAIAGEMQGIVERTDRMQKLTTVQAERSQQVTAIAEEQATGARQTVQGAGQVVEITNELQNLSQEMTKQVSQYKIGSSLQAEAGGKS